MFFNRIVALVTLGLVMVAAENIFKTEGSKCPKKFSIYEVPGTWLNILKSQLEPSLTE